MQRQLEQLRYLTVEKEVPLFIVGDIFDRWNPPPQLINFAIAHLPPCYAIPGQHDLPYHRYEDIEKSAYWTLVEAGIIKDLPPGRHAIGELVVHSFPWGTPLTACTSPANTFGIDVLMAHRYLWKTTHGYPGAPKDKSVSALRDILSSYDACFFGDNHSGFLHGSCLNCGAFLRRKSDEQQYLPKLGLLHSPARIELFGLDVERDQFLVRTRLDQFHRDVRSVSGFIEELDNLRDNTIDFRSALQQYCVEHPVLPEVENWILRAMEEE